MPVAHLLPAEGYSHDENEARMDELNLNDQQLLRRQKVAELRRLGIDPYPPRLSRERTHTAAQALAAYRAGALAPEQQVTLVGRLMTIRLMGKAAFAHIEDGSGRIQIYVKRDLVGTAFYDDIFKKLIDLGDIILVTGTMFATRTGEITCQVSELSLLSKTLTPLPDKWHGLKDTETRYRQRYVDLLANDEVRDVFRTRATILAAIRRYLDGNGFLEVETPVLQPIYGGAAARPFTTHHNQLDQELFLRISFELYLKRLLVGGYERVYEIGRDFRNEGISFKHNPEFTQLEFYEAYTDYNGMMCRVEEMVAAISQAVTGDLKITYNGHDIDLTPPWRRVKMVDAIRDATGIDYSQYPDAAALAAAIKAAGYQVDPEVEPRQADRCAFRRSRRAHADPADLHHRLPGGDQPAGEEEGRRPDHRRKVRVFHRRPRNGQRFQRAERSRGPASALRGLARCDGRRG